MTDAMPAQQTVTLTLDQALQQAIAHHQAGQWPDAERLYRTILLARPNHPDANHNLGVLAVQTQQPAASLPYFKAALATRQSHGQYWLSYIDALLQTGLTDHARQALAQGRQTGLQGPAVDALADRLAVLVASFAQPRSGPAARLATTTDETAPRSEPSQQALGALLVTFNQQRNVEAEFLARSMTESFPQHGFGWKVLGAVLKQLGRNAEAVHSMQKAAALLPGDYEAHYNLGVALKDLGQLGAAEASYRRALAIKPDYAEAYNNLGNVLKSLGRLNDAELSLRRALAIKPDYADAHNNLGNVLKELGRSAEAIASCRQALAIKPDQAEAYYSLGNAHKDLGQLDEAVANYRQALQTKADYAVAHNNLGATLMELGRLDEAAGHYRRVLELEPNLAAAHYNLGNTLKDLGQLAAAEASYRRALQIEPDLAVAHNNLGVTLHEFGRLAEAETCYGRALQLKADYAEAHNNLGLTRRDLGRLADAEASYRQAIQLKADYADAHSNLGNTLMELGRLDEAEASNLRALQIKPDYAVAHSNLGNTLHELGRLTEAEASYRRALQIKPDYADAHDNLLFLLNYSAHHAPVRCLAEARRYGYEIGKKITAQFAQWSCAQHAERLRIGFVSGDFRNHPVGYFLESLLTRIDPTAFDLIAYPTYEQPDELTARIKPHFLAWKPLSGLSDAAAAGLIHRDQVHILIDLAGHTRHNRLPIFAWKPAPVQVSWLGYFATTGVAAIDYLIADPWVLPETEETYFTEKIWRLPNSRLCFAPPDIAMEVSPLPALTNGHVTFGSFSNLSKMVDEVVTLWSRVLAAVPNSRLFLKAKQLKDHSVRQNTIERFAAHGISADRLILEGAESRAKYLAAYHRLDIALDPFPYPGGTTSVEGLWMGVPVLTLSGERFLSRQGVGILINAGLPQWIAADPDDYVARAAAHASDLARLATLRHGLRQRVLASPIMDGRRFANDFKAALRGMWLTTSGQQAVKESIAQKNSGEKNPSPQEINALATLFSSGRSTEAAPLAQALTVNFPAHGFGWKVLGALLKQAGRSAEALAPMQKAAALAPGDAEVHSNLGATLKELGCLNEAEASYRRALTIKPQFAEAHNNLGNTLLDLGRTNDAEASFQQALQIKPDYAEAHYNLGNTFIKLARPDAAEASYRRALTIKPEYAEAHRILGATLHDSGRLDEAEASYRRALEIEADFTEALFNLGHLLRDRDDLEQAAAAYRKLWQMDPTDRGLDAALYLAILSYLNGNLEQCRRMLDASHSMLTQAGRERKSIGNYWPCLDKLLSWHTQTNPESDRASGMCRLYVIGESHSLPTHGVVVRYNHRKMLCRAEWIEGCKQWHLGNDRANKYKHKFEMVMARLPRASTILLTIGEIDCRHDEGVLKAWRKSPDRSLEDMVQATAGAYLAYVATTAAAYEHKVIIAGVPANNLPANTLTASAAEQFVHLIRIFNSTLQRLVLSSGMDFLDVYSLTERRAGMASGEWHIDNHHLRPSAVVAAFDRHCLKWNSGMNDS